MQFVYPSFLWALALVAIPIIIHLFNLRRYKRVYFTNVKHLKEIQQQTKRKRNLRQLLILFSRIFAVAALVVLFAQPFIPQEEQEVVKGQRLVSIYIDNSFSMQGESESGPLLEVAKAKCNDLLKAFPESDHFQIITNEFKPSSSRFLSRLDAQGVIDDITISPATKSLDKVLEKIQETDGSESYVNKQVYLLSDFQGLDEDSEFETDTTHRYFAVPFESRSFNNLSIDSIWFESPFIKSRESLSLNVKLSNHGYEDMEAVTLKLFIDGQQKTIQSVDLIAGSTLERSLNFSVNEAGWKSGQLTIEDYPIQFDNNYNFAFNVRKQVQVLEIFETVPSTYLQKLYSADDFFVHQSTSRRNLDYSEITNMDLVILNGLNEIPSGLNKVLNQYLEAGKAILVIPNEDNNPSLLNNAGKPMFSFSGTNEESDVIRLETKHPLMEKVFESIPDNIDLPKVKKSFVLRSNELFFRPLMRMSNQEAFLSEIEAGKGTIYCLAVPLNDAWSNFQEHALFVPLCLKMAFANNAELPLAYEVGSQRLIEVLNEDDKGEAGYKIIGKDLELTPELIVSDSRTLLNEGGQIEVDGNYQLKYADTVTQQIAFNYSRNESVKNDLDATERDEKLKTEGFTIYNPENTNLGQAVKAQQNGNQLWRWFAFLSLFFLAIEILLLRFWPKG